MPVYRLGPSQKFSGKSGSNIQCFRCQCIYSRLKVDRIWSIWGSYYKIPNAIFYLLEGDHTPCLCACVCSLPGDLQAQEINHTRVLQHNISARMCSRSRLIGKLHVGIAQDAEGQIKEYLVVYLNRGGGPQHRPEYTMVLIIGVPKTVPPILGTRTLHINIPPCNVPFHVIFHVLFHLNLHSCQTPYTSIPQCIETPTYCFPVLGFLYKVLLSITQEPTIWVPGLLGLYRNSSLQIMLKVRPYSLQVLPALGCLQR